MPLWAEKCILVIQQHREKLSVKAHLAISGKSTWCFRAARVLSFTYGQTLFQLLCRHARLLQARSHVRLVIINKMAISKMFYNQPSSGCSDSSNAKQKGMIKKIVLPFQGWFTANRFSDDFQQELMVSKKAKLLD